MLEEKNLNKRFDEIEKRMELLMHSQSVPDFSAAFQQRSDEIDLREIWDILWGGKWWILGITFLFSLAGVVYALSLPNKYTSLGIYAPSQKKGGGPLAGQLGGLAAIAGMNLNSSETNDIDQAIALVKSWPFLEKIVDQYELKPLIMGVKSRDKETGKLNWNEDVYDPINKRWVREPSPGKLAEPSSYETYNALSKMVTVNYDAKTSLLNISVEHYSPDVAREWVRLLVDQLNEAFRERDMSEAKRNISYLEKKIAETSISEMQNVFYGMIETQMKTLMLAEVDREYLIKQVVEPKVSEIKSSPNRKIILVLSCLIGFGGGSLIIWVLGFVRLSRSGKQDGE